MSANLTFLFNREDYNHLAAAALPTNATKADKIMHRARELLAFKDRYVGAQTRTGIPALWYAVINERESGSDFGTYLGNGQSLRRVTTLVPAGRGPWKTWEDGAADATTYDHVGRPGPDGWTWAWFLFKCEGWNGFGPRLHGRHTGYLWSGTQVYDTGPGGGGKYVSDGVWDPSAHDTQLGVYPLARALVELDPSLDLIGPDPFTTSWSGVPAVAPPVVSALEPQNEKLAGVRWIQDSLNKIQSSGLIVDGSYGRHTRAAIRKFQEVSSIAVDGQAGNETCSAIDAALVRMSKSSNISKSPADAAPVISSHKGRSMDLNSIINLAQLVAPKFVPALGAVNPLLPVAINVLGEALGAVGPHTLDSVSASASNKAADEVAMAIKTASEAYAKHIETAAASHAPVTQAPVTQAPVTHAPAMTTTTSMSTSTTTSPPSTGGLYVDRLSSGAMQIALAIGSALLGSGLLDPNGPLSGVLHAYPLAGALLAVVSWFIHDRMVKASNDATAATTEPAK
jgi:lysozyme family protein